MKTFRFIGMALFAVLMCVNLASCSSDDDPTDESPQYELVTSGKKLEIQELLQMSKRQQLWLLLHFRLQDSG